MQKPVKLSSEEVESLSGVVRKQWRKPSPLVVDSHHAEHIKNPLDYADLLIVQD